MKTLKILLTLGSAWLITNAVIAGVITVEFEEVDKYSDFSVSGLSEEKTKGIFESELERELKIFSERYIPGDYKLHIIFKDIDMAGDIQPWRNQHNADIRYIERVYPPRMELAYTLTDGNGDVLQEGAETISDISFDFNILAPIRTQSMSFFYEINMLENWIRKTFRPFRSNTR